MNFSNYSTRKWQHARGDAKRGAESHNRQFDVILSCITKIWHYLAVVYFRRQLNGLMVLIIIHSIKTLLRVSYFSFKTVRVIN